jgi:hypothetical protein
VAAYRAQSATANANGVVGNERWCYCVSGEAKSLQRAASAGRQCVAAKRRSKHHDLACAHGMERVVVVMVVIVVIVVAVVVEVSTASLQVTSPV